MKINKHIAAVAASSDNTHNDTLLQHIWNNRSSAQFFTVNVVSVARSGASRTMEVFAPFQGRIVNITHLMADVLGNSIKNGAMVVKGGGMDMVFSSLYGFYMSIGSKQLKKVAFKFRAVNSYKLS